MLSLAVFGTCMGDELSGQMGMRAIFNKRMSKHREGCMKSS